MTFRLHVTPAAEDDLLDGFEWYEDKQEGLGVAFLAEVDATLLRVVERPEMYQEINTDVRRGVTRTFPYCVFYSIDVDQVVVLAVIQAAQDPSYIRARLDA